MSDAGRKRRLEELQVGSLGVLAMGTAYQPEVAHKVRELVHTLKGVLDPAKELPTLKVTVRALLDICKNEENLDVAAKEGTIDAVVKLLQVAPTACCPPGQDDPPVGVEELERDICFLLGLLAIRSAHQACICAAGALPALVALVARYAARGETRLSGVPAAAARRAADAVTNLAHENGGVKDRVRGEGGVPHLVALLRCTDAKVQRAAAGALRTLAFKNEGNKALIVALGALPLLVQMLGAEDATLHYEAVGVVGNLVHSSAAIKRAVLEAGALQPIVNLLSSPCPDSQREAALLLGQFATEGGCKAAIVQRGAVPPLVDMLSHVDGQLREMAAFALGRLAQDADNQAGIVAGGGLAPLLDLLESRQGGLQHNAAFALYGLADSDDNLVEFVREGAVQRMLAADLVVQPSRDCMAKTLRRLQERLRGRAMGQILYGLQHSPPAQRLRVAVALCALCTADSPSAASKKLVLLDRGGLDPLLDALADPAAPAEAQEAAAGALVRAADCCACCADDGAANGGGTGEEAAARAPAAMVGDGMSTDNDQAPAAADNNNSAEAMVVDDATAAAATVSPQTTTTAARLPASMVNSPVGSDVAFEVEGRRFYAHRAPLRAASEVFAAMLGGEYRERDAELVPIPNVRWDAWHAAVSWCYTGDATVVNPTLARQLLPLADQYMLDGLKRACETAIASGLRADNFAGVFELGEAHAAPGLAARAALFCLRRHAQLSAPPLGSRAGFAVAMQRMAPRLRAALADKLRADAAEEEAEQRARRDAAAAAQQQQQQQQAGAAEGGAEPAAVAGAAPPRDVAPGIRTGAAPRSSAAAPAV